MATVLYDAECAFCCRVRDLFAALDAFGAMEWMALQEPSAERFGIPRDELRQRIYMVAGDRRWSGFEVVRQILLRLPAAWAAAACAVSRRPQIALPLLLAFLSPLANAPGERAYDWISRHRWSFPGRACWPKA
ncbi:MAG: thiol-disulfide oxidoreductase DCC family protein [Bryobacteraceae bacterium]